jgi:hypothetical protein
MANSENRPTGGFRFSIRALLAGMVVVALLIHGYLLTARNQRLEVENRRLRDQLMRFRDKAGALTIEDESQLHAIRIETDNELQWTWRIWIPAGRTYRLCSVAGRVPQAGFARPGETITLSQPGGQLVHYRVQKDPRDGRWYGALSTTKTTADKDEHPWVEWNSKASLTNSIEMSTQVFSPDERVLLVRKRVARDMSTVKAEKHSAGFLIWLEPE